MITDVTSNENIEVFLNASVESVDGFIGNFKTTIQTNADSQVLEHGVTLMATGAEEFKSNDYLYGQDQRVLTGLELQKKILDQDGFDS